MDTTESKENTDRREEGKKRAKKPGEESGHLDESWGSAGRRGGIKEEGVSFSCSLSMGVYVPSSVCVRTVHMCISAGGVEQGVIPDGHTQTHTNDRFHPLASCNHNSADLLIACYSTRGILTLKPQHMSRRCVGHGKVWHFLSNSAKKSNKLNSCSRVEIVLAWHWLQQLSTKNRRHFVVIYLYIKAGVPPLIADGKHLL